MRLILAKFVFFLFVVLDRRQPIFVLRKKLYQIFLRIRSKSLKTRNFVIRQRKFKNNTGVFLQNFLQNFAKFLFLNRININTFMTKTAKALPWNRYHVLHNGKKYKFISNLRFWQVVNAIFPASVCRIKQKNA